jgi:hypothetical protein
LILRKEVSKMKKVHILDRCKFCDGEVNVPAEDAESSKVERYYLPVSPI